VKNALHFFAIGGADLTPRSRIPSRAKIILQATTMVSKMNWISSLDNWPCVEVVRVIESAAPPASPRLPDLA